MASWDRLKHAEQVVAYSVCFVSIHRTRMRCSQYILNIGLETYVVDVVVASFDARDG